MLLPWLAGSRKVTVNGSTILSTVLTISGLVVVHHTRPQAEARGEAKETHSVAYSCSSAPLPSQELAQHPLRSICGCSDFLHLASAGWYHRWGVTTTTTQWSGCDHGQWCGTVQTAVSILCQCCGCGSSCCGAPAVGAWHACKVSKCRSVCLQPLLTLETVRRKVVNSSNSLEDEDAAAATCHGTHGCSSGISTLY